MCRRWNYLQHILLVALCFLAGPAFAADTFHVGGSARFRFELRENRDFNSGVNDVLDFVGTRLRLDVKFTPADYLEAFVQPQFAGVWGQVESNVSAGGVVTGGAFTSGALRDRELDLHQGYVLWHAHDRIDFKIGRQELVYGEHVVIGNVGFSNVGRAFDAGLVRFFFGDHSVDLFYAKLAEVNGNGALLSGDVDFSGIYAQFSPGGLFKAVDGYLLWLRDDRAGDPEDFNFATIGSRMLVQSGIWDSRLEGNVQLGDRLGANMFAYMIDVEQGVKFAVRDGLRFAVGYNLASGDDPTTGTFTRYHQLFPTAHRWLGFLDFFGRQNIQSGTIRIRMNWNDQWATKLHAHSFWRVRQADLLYGLTAEVPTAGQATPPTSTSKHAGEEVDLVVVYKPHPLIDLELFGGFFIPGAYIDSAIGDDVAYFTYLQAMFRLP